MTGLDILTSFELEIDKIDDELNKPATNDSLYWINQAVAKFIKLRFNGDNIHNTSYEQTEKRRNDLDRLFKQEELILGNPVPFPNYHKYTIIYPKDFLYALNEDVEIVVDDERKSTCVFECTQDSFMYRINNSLTDFHLYRGKARPIRTRTNNGCYLYTDGNYYIYKYILGYIRLPLQVSLDDPYTKYEDFDDSTWYEIIKIAAQMYLENKKDERYKTITQEVITQE